MRQVRLFVLVLLVATGISVPVGAQVTGIYPFGSFDTPGFDTINRGNLNVHFTIPVFSKPGRGATNFVYYLNYDGLIWQPVTANGVTTWTPAPEWGWTDVSNALYGYITVDFSLSNCSYYEGKIIIKSVESSYTNYEYHDNKGAAHAIPYSFAGTCGGGGPTGTASYTLTDNSGLTLYRNGNSFIAFTAQGAEMAVPLYTKFDSYSMQSGDLASTFTDTNGNEISASPTAFTDTMGKTVLTVSGSAPNPVVYTYTDSNNNSQTVTVNYTLYTVQTAFGAPGILEYSASDVPLVSSIVYSGDGTSYSIGYECTPGHSGSGCPVTGRIASITLRTGGTISYAYTGGYHGIESDGTTAGLSRTTSDGTATWTRSGVTTTSSNTTYTDATTSQNQTVSDFLINPSGYFYEISGATYQGTAGGTPLTNVQICYNSSQGSCSGNISSGLTAMSSVERTTSENGIEISDVYQQYAGPELMQSSEEMISEVTTSYNYDQYTGIDNIPFWRVTEVSIKSSIGSTISSVSYGYDETTAFPTSGLPQHIAVTTPRGNLTSVTQCCASDGTAYKTQYTTDDAGQRLTVAFNGTTTTYSYDSATDTLLQGVTLPKVNNVTLSSGYTFDPNTGLLISAQGPNTNNPPTSYQYDGMMRPTLVTFPDGGKTQYTYPSATQTSIYQYQNATAYADTEIVVDGYGRPIRAAVANGQGTNPWYQQDTCYDADGKVGFSSYRYQGTGIGAPEVCSGNGDTYSYDAVGRVTKVLHSDGTYTTETYNGHAAELVDENNVTRIIQVNSIGLPAGVCEVSSGAGIVDSGTVSSCGLDISGTGYLTSYTYQFSDRGVAVTQGSQTRTFFTDGLGRPTLTQEPESGQTTYSYTYNPTGLLATRTRPEANQTGSNTTTTSYQYDALNRLVSVSYSDGTPTREYVYDTDPGWSVGPTNLLGRLSLAETVSGSTMQTGDAFSYDPMGRILSIWECAPMTCGGPNQASRVVSYNYDWTGNVTLEDDPASGQIQYQRSIAGEVTQITNGSFTLQGSAGQATLLSSVSNGPDGPTSWTIGNGLSGVRQYNANGTSSGGWLCSLSNSPDCTGGTQIHGWTLGVVGSRVNSYCDSSLPECANLGYNDLDQMTSMTSTSGNVENLTWSYDRWGNRWGQTVTAGSGPQPQFSFDTANNQITTSGYAYDAAGNLTSDSTHSYTYDGNGNIISIDSGSTATYVYDALNNRVELAVGGGASADAVFDAAGRITSTWTSPTAYGEGHIFWDGSQLGLRSGDGKTYFKETDWEGTDRVHTDSSGGTGATFTSLPYGDDGNATVTEPYAGWDFGNYADLSSESWSGTDEAIFRRYAPTSGRWMSPDPYSGSYDFSNPQSLNRYSYVQNQPLSAIDPEGMMIYAIGEGGGTWNDCAPDESNCTPNDGGWGWQGGVLDAAAAQSENEWLQNSGISYYFTLVNILSSEVTIPADGGYDVYLTFTPQYAYTGPSAPMDPIVIASNTQPTELSGGAERGGTTAAVFMPGLSDLKWFNYQACYAELLECSVGVKVKWAFEQGWSKVPGVSPGINPVSNAQQEKMGAEACVANYAICMERVGLPSGSLSF